MHLESQLFAKFLLELFFLLLFADLSKFNVVTEPLVLLTRDDFGQKFPVARGAFLFLQYKVVFFVSKIRFHFHAGDLLFNVFQLGEP